MAKIDELVKARKQEIKDEEEKAAKERQRAAKAELWSMIPDVAKDLLGMNIDEMRHVLNRSIRSESLGTFHSTAKVDGVLVSYSLSVAPPKKNPCIVMEFSVEGTYANSKVKLRGDDKKMTKELVDAIAKL